MCEYLLDTNVVIALWNKHPFIIDKLIEENKIKILKEIGEELVVKERKGYKGKQALSERFCKLLLFVIDVDKKDMEKFYSMLDIKYSEKGNAYLDNTNKLSRNDILLLSACYLNDNLILVTEDKYLFNSARKILGEDRVLNSKELIEQVC